MKSREVRVIRYDLAAVSQFFRSAAVAAAIKSWLSQERSKEGGTVPDVLATVLLGMETGDQNGPDCQRIAAEANDLHAKFVGAWLDKVSVGGPMVGNSFVAHTMGFRDKERTAIASALEGTIQSPSDLAAALVQATHGLTHIKLGGALGLAAVEPGAGLALLGGAQQSAGAGIGLAVASLKARRSRAGLRVTHTVATGWHEGVSADVAAVAIDDGKGRDPGGAGPLVTRSTRGILTDQAASRHVLRLAGARVRKISLRLEQLAATSASRGAPDEGAPWLPPVLSRGFSEAGPPPRRAKPAGRFGTPAPIVYASWSIIDVFGA